MKTLNALLLAATILLPTFLSSAPALARGGDMGNAGDLYVREVYTTARDILMRMKLLPPSELEGIDLRLLDLKIQTVNMRSDETVYDPVRKEFVWALNYPNDNLLLISRTLWEPLRGPSQTERRLSLVLHEMLYFIGVDDAEFRRSDSIIQIMKIPPFSSSRYWNPLNPVNRISTNLIYNPGNCALKGFDFDTQVQEESFQQETTGDCGDAARKVSVRKISLQAPPSSGWKGLFQRFEISVSDAQGATLSQVTAEPEWGRCLLPEEGGCEVGGKIFAGGVEFRFWFKR